MKIQRGYILLVFIVMAVTACQASVQSTEVDMIKSTQLPSPAKDKASIIGRVVNLDGKPLGSVTVRLAEVFRKGEEGAFVLDVTHSPSNVTDSDGYFNILDFAPREYLIVIGEPSDNNYVIYQKEGNKPQTYKMDGGQMLDVGTLKVDFTP